MSLPYSKCSNVGSIICHASTPPVCEALAFEWIFTSRCTLKVPVGTVPLYQAADQWKDFWFIVDETDINDIPTQQDVKAIYTPNGKKLDKLQKGLNIILMNDGTIKKKMVK